jgi:2-polyprenyl-3-methyl-5-hydroxy-6-metoxy-1,4-benzoquinol methylase
MKQYKINDAELKINIKKKLKEFYGLKGCYSAENYSILVGQYGINSSKIVDPSRFMIMYHDQLRKIVSMVPKNADLLDVGTGDGVLASKLMDSVKKFFGLDISEGRILRCAETYNKGHFIIADAEELPFKEESFDCIVASEIIEHLIEPERFVLSAYHILKRDGILIVSTPSALFYENNLAEILKDQHLHTFSPRSLKKLLKKTGFETGKMNGIGFKVRFRLSKPFAMIPRFIFALIKGREPKRGFFAPVSVEWNIVSNKFLNKLYISHKKMFEKIFDFLILIGHRFPSLSSQIIVQAKRL